MKLLIRLIIILNCVNLCLAEETESQGQLKFDRDKIIQQIGELDFQNKTNYLPETQKYFTFYGLLPSGSVKHVFGTFKAGKEVLSAHFYVPEKYKGTVIFLHGYHDHTGVFAKIIQYLSANQFAVAVYDLPGHGLSTGHRAECIDFSDYLPSLTEFIRICKTNLSGPVHLIAYSMGAAIGIEYILNKRTVEFNRIVLVSPLIRCANWDLANLGTQIIPQFIRTVPRFFRNDSGDQEFRKFHRTDPLQFRRQPTNWARALRLWNRKTVTYQPADKPVLVIQGTVDCIVDWKYNLVYIQSKFPHAEIQIIENGNHQLLNETLPIKEQVFLLIAQYLQ